MSKINISSIIEEFKKKSVKMSEQWFEDIGDGNGNYDLWVIFIEKFIRKEIEKIIDSIPREDAERYFGDLETMHRRDGYDKHVQEIKQWISEVKL